MAKPKPAPAKKKKATPPAPADGTLSTDEFATRVGVSRQRVLKAIEGGVLSASVQKKTVRGKPAYRIKEGVGLKEWADNIDPAKQRDSEKQAETKALGKGAGTTEASTFQKSKAAKEFFSAKLAELDYNERAKKLVSADKVKAEAFKIGRRVRDSLMAVPDRVAAEVANMTEPRPIAIYLKEQIALALKDLGSLNDVGGTGA